MKVTSVRYERLFSMEKYHNERIGFESHLANGESEGQALGELFFKVLAIEDHLQAYRNCLEGLQDTERRISDMVGQIGYMEQKIAETKVSIDKLAKGEPDDRLKAACERESLKTQMERLEYHRNVLENLEREKTKLLEQRELLAAKIKAGDFTAQETVEALLKTRQMEAY